MSSEPRRRSNRRERGFTLIEAIVAIVIIGVAVAGVLSVFQLNVRHSADPLVRKQLLAVAEEMIEEIALRPYDGADKAAQTACERSSFDDVSDYDGYPANGQVCDVEGHAIEGLNGYTLAVRVIDAGLEGAPAKRIEVTVARGADQLTLVSWRTGYAQH